MYISTQQDNVGYNLAYIEDDFEFPHLEEFDQAYMRALYDYGEKKAKGGYKWFKEPFGLSVK
jgi:hypothetical protein